MAKAPGHILCVAPTGAGKSLIYEEWCHRTGQRMLLVTPLVALARQQVSSLKSRGIHVALGTGDHKESPGPKTQAWIISPESLQFQSRVRAIRDWKPELLVVDECHCIWDWGLEFRPAFNQIPALLRQLSIPRSLWLTATLPLSARRDLKSRLPDPITEIGQFSLPPSFQLNALEVPSADRAEALLRWMDLQDGPGIVFVSTRQDTERLTRLFVSVGKKAIPYHAGLGAEERRIAEALIRASQSEIVVSTSAFGMGMDHKHLNWVALWQPSPSLLAMTQAIGRAGRNPKTPGKALVLWNNNDFRLSLARLSCEPKGDTRRREELERVYRFLGSGSCRNQNLTEYFTGCHKAATEPRTACGCCDICRE